MNKRKISFVLAIAVATSVLILGMKVYYDMSFRMEQAELAEHLGDDVEGYFPAPSFPKNYFYSTLKPGMTKATVHKIVVEYKAVFTCSKFSELYYYYSVNNSKAVRFKIIYDFDEKYYKIMGEDDSSNLYDDGCIPGRSDD
jgi:hypothetical protein